LLKLSGTELGYFDRTRVFPFGAAVNATCDAVLVPKNGLSEWYLPAGLVHKGLKCAVGNGLSRSGFGGFGEADGRYRSER
jgi:hypothetical protein